MKHASFFSGIGGFEIGFAAAGIATVSACELDPFARRVYEARFGTPPLFHDIAEVHPNEIPPADIWSAGFPCQDLSQAGARRGFAGERSSLVFRFFELADVCRPEWIVLENVCGLLHAPPGDARARRGVDQAEPVRSSMGRLLGALADLGYVGAWRVLDAQYTGVPQRRRRVIVVGHLGARDRACAVLSEPESVCGRAHTGEEAGADAADGSGGRARGGRVAGTLRARTGSGHGVAGPDDDAQAGHLLVARPLLTSGQRIDGESDTFIVSPTVTESLCRGETNGEVASEMLIPVNLEQVTHPENRSACRPGSPAYAVAATGRGAVASPAFGVRRLTPLEAERLQGFPDGWSCTCGCAPYSTATCRCPDGPRYRALGNAIPTTLAMWVGRRLARTIKTFVGVRCRVETLRRSLLTRGSGACSAEVP